MLLLRFFSEKETETERATLLDFNHFENTDFSISCLPFSGSILRYYVKWIITLSHFHTSLLKLSFEPINFWFNWSHLFGSCQSVNLWGFFLPPICFFASKIGFFGSFHCPYKKNFRGHSLFFCSSNPLSVLILFFSFCSFFVLCLILVLHFVIPCTWIYQSCFPQLEKRRTWLVLRFWYLHMNGLTIYLVFHRHLWRLKGTFEVLMSIEKDTLYYISHGAFVNLKHAFIH